jgi:hypothetical protein
VLPATEEEEEEDEEEEEEEEEEAEEATTVPFYVRFRTFRLTAAIALASKPHSNTKA